MTGPGGGGGFADGLLGGGDEVAADAAVADDVGVFGEAAEVGQVEVEGGEVGDAADGVQGAGLVEVGLEGEGVGGGAGVGEVEEGLVEEAVALDVPVAGLEAGADLGEALGLEEEAAEDGALGFFAVRQGLRGGPSAALLRRRTSSPLAVDAEAGEPAREERRRRGGGGAASSSGRSWLVTMVGRPRSSRVRVMSTRRSSVPVGGGAGEGLVEDEERVTRRGARTSSTAVKSRWMRRDSSGPEIQRPRLPVRRCSARRTVARPVLPVPVGPQRATQCGVPVQCSEAAGQGRWKWAAQLSRVRRR